MIERINGLKGLHNLEIQKNKKTTGQNDLNFSQMLKDAINEVNDLQVKSDKMTADYAAGRITSIEQVTVAAEKASLSLKLTTEVTSKVIEAYKEIMRLQL
ncbi:MAG TPA: flagellar hook-basal body complex protein FliE [Petrotogaceae bacterium]|nr:flagellar hook-basal body complex protein FliE [Petrotogaceae bacterium]